MFTLQLLLCPRPPQVWRLIPRPRLTELEVDWPRGCQFFFQSINSAALLSSCRYTSARSPARSAFLEKNSSGSIFSLAARSSRAHIVSTAAWGWFGARQARAGPVFVLTDVWRVTLLGMPVKT